VCCTDGEWTLFKSPENEGPLYYYSSAIFQSLIANSVSPAEDSGYFIPGVDLTQWRVPVGAEALSRKDFLFHRAEDPGQKKNLWKSEPQQRDRMLKVIRDLLIQEGAPKEQYERLGIGMG
jgi:hypothetical protein